MNSLMRLVLNQIDHDDTLALLRDLIRIPSHRNVPEQESKVAEYIAHRLEKFGIDVKLRDVADGRPNVVGVIKGSGDGHSLMLSGHADTVPLYGWNADVGPFSGEMRQGKVYGRGAVDMKGGLAAMIVAMEAIKKSGVELKGDLVFTGVVGEEGSCSIGTKEIIRNGPITDFAVVGEETSLNVGIANRGSCDLEITTRGRTAHSGEPEKGINAIVKMANVVKALEKEVVSKLKGRKHRLMGSSVMNIGKIEGGIYGDVVPDLCKLSARIRYIPVYNPEDLKEIVNGVLQKLRKKDPAFDAEVTIKVKRCSWRWGEVVLEALPRVVSKDSMIVKVLKRNLKRVIGKYPKFVCSKGWGDSSLLVNEANIPAVEFGPGDGGAHSSLEYLDIDQLHKAADALALTSLDICL